MTKKNRRRKSFSDSSAIEIDSSRDDSDYEKSSSSSTDSSSTNSSLTDSSPRNYNEIKVNK